MTLVRCGFYGPDPKQGDHRSLDMRKVSWGVDDRISLQHSARYQLQNISPCPSCTKQARPKQLSVVGKVGSGSFGCVYLVQNSGKKLALKAMEKKKLQESGHPEQSVHERKVLCSVKFPFIVEGFGHFQTRTHLYILMEYVEGCELWDILKSKEGRAGLCTNDCLFYLSEICITLEYLHSIDIVYRDLKLENVLIDKEGHVKLVDFGFSKKMVTSRTLCGTPDYLAPEILLGKSYTKGL